MNRKKTLANHSPRSHSSLFAEFEGLPTSLCILPPVFPEASTMAAFGFGAPWNPQKKEGTQHKQTRKLGEAFFLLRGSPV